MSSRHAEKRRTLWRYLLALPRSLWINLRLLPFAQAWRLPLLVSHRTWITGLSGQLALHVDKPRMGLVKIGFATCQLSDFHYHRTRFGLQGRMEVWGECAFGAGSTVEVAPTGCLIVGDHFLLGPQSLLLCHKEVNCGDHVRISWRCTLMDTDQHDLVNAEGNRVNLDRSIRLADHVWVGCNSILLKGVSLASYTTVGAGSVVHGSFDEPHTVLAGNPACIVKRGVIREV